MLELEGGVPNSLSESPRIPFPNGIFLTLKEGVRTLFGAGKEHHPWALEIAVGILMRPQRLLLRWFARPRLMEVTAALRTLSSPKDGITPSIRLNAGPPPVATVASL